MALQAGTKLGPYEILDPIGAGGMGEVYRARDTKLGREVAIKVLPEAFAQNEERLARFEREARLLASLNHPNIATLHGLESLNGVEFLIMELVPGETLADKIARGPVSPKDALPLFRQIAEGLQAAHEKGIIHRDLKPSNVKITPEDSVKLLDFGLAKAFEEEPDPSTDLSQSPTLTRGTATGVILGTAPYMSPEQARGKPVDQRTDIWAFGCCLFETLTGRVAFLGETVSDTLSAILGTEADWKKIPGNTPRRVQQLLRRCLRKDASRRLQHIGDARIEIEESISGAPEPELDTDAGSPVSRRERIVLWSLVAVLATGLAALLLPGKPDPEPDTRPEIRLRQLTGRSENDTVRSAALSPDGESLALATEKGLFLQLVATGEEQRIPLPEGLQIHEVDWLVGGSTLLLSAAFGDETGLYKTSIFGGTPTKLSDDAWRATVSPDGARIAYLQSLPSKVVRIMDADGRNSRTLAQLEGDDSFWEIAWSPDARWLLIGRWGGSISAFDTVLEAIDIATGEVHQVMSDPRFFQEWRGFLPFLWTHDGRLIFARRDPPPNELSSNLWQVEIDRETASLHGEPVRLTQLAAINLKDLSLTADGRSVSFLLERNQADVLVANLVPDRTLRDVRYITTDEREDQALGWSPDRQSLYFASARTGVFGLFRVNTEEQGRPQFLALRGMGTHFFEASRDGRSVTYWTGAELKRVPAEGGPVETILAAGGWPGHSCTSDGARCLLGERSRDGLHYTLFALDLEKGKGEEVLRFANESTFTNWDLSPDGTMVVVGGLNDRLRIFDLQTKEETVLEIEGWHYGEFPAWAADGRGIYVDGGPVSRGPLRKGLVYISLDGEVQSLRQDWNEWITHVVPTADGKRLAFSSQRFSANVWMIEAP